MEGKQEILEAIHAFSTSIDVRLEHMEHDISWLKKDVSELKQDVSILKEDVSGLKGDVSKLKGDMIGVKSAMVTKDYLDRKMAEQRADIISVLKKEDGKVKMLTGILHENGGVTREQKETIFAAPPFAER